MPYAGPAFPAALPASLPARPFRSRARAPRSGQPPSGQPPPGQPPPVSPRSAPPPPRSAPARSAPAGQPPPGQPPPGQPPPGRAPSGRASSAQPGALRAGRGGIPVSATLAANEAMAARGAVRCCRSRSATPACRWPPACARRWPLTARNGYGPVAGQGALRSAAAGYWRRRGLPTDPDAVICGPGSKPLIFALLLAIGADVAVPSPSWVSYAAQADLIGARSHFVPAPPGEGGICDPERLAAAISAARAAGRRIGAVIVTLPDNPTGRLARPDTVRALCRVADEHGLVIISDEIYRDLIHDPAAAVLSPAAIAPHRTVVTTALSKNLALGGWRIGVARMADGPLGRSLREAVTWRGQRDMVVAGRSDPAGRGGRVRRAPGYFRTDSPEPVAARQRGPRGGWPVRRGRAAGAATGGRVLPLSRFRAVAGAPARGLGGDHRGGAGPALARALRRRGAARQRVGESARALRIRIATGLLYGEDDAQREAALQAAEPVTLPWIAAALDRFGEILADLAR